MTGKLHRLNEKVEAGLYRRGYTHPDVRQLVRNQFYLMVASLLLGGLLAPVLPAALHFAAGTVLISFNFFSLARFAQGLTRVKHGAVVALLARFYGRLILTGAVLFVLIVWANAPIVALLAGISTVVVNAVYWGITRHNGQNAKEA
jgi:small-conductance mechanosensitive channel